MDFDVVVCFKGLDIPISISSYIPYKPAKIYGPPEDCYPAEGDEVEWDLDDTMDEGIYEFLEYAGESIPDMWDDIEELVLEEIRYNYEPQ